MYVGEIDAEVKDLLKSANEVEVQPQERDVDVNALLSAMLRNVSTQYSLVRTTSDLTPEARKVRAIYSQLSTRSGTWYLMLLMLCLTVAL